MAYTALQTGEISLRELREGKANDNDHIAIRIYRASRQIIGALNEQKTQLQTLRWELQTRQEKHGGGEREGRETEEVLDDMHLRLSLLGHYFQELL